MAITSTTLSGAITSTQTSFGVASATNITAPNFQTGAGITVLQIDQEYILITAAPNGTTVSNVVRGYNGSPAQAHVNGALVQVGLPSDFPTVQEIWGGLTVQASQSVGNENQPGINLSGSADAINPAVSGFYVVKTAGVDAMTLAAPPASAEGNIITIISDTTNAHTLTATSLLAAGSALKTTATWPAFRGAVLTLRACNGVWQVLAAGGALVAGTMTGTITLS